MDLDCNHGFDLSLWRGAYQVQNIFIQKRDTELENSISLKNIEGKK